MRLLWIGGERGFARVFQLMGTCWNLDRRPLGPAGREKFTLLGGGETVVTLG